MYYTHYGFTDTSTNHESKNLEIMRQKYESIISMADHLHAVNDQIDKMSLTELESRETNRLAESTLKKLELFLRDFEADELELLMDKASYLKMSKDANALCRLLRTESTWVHPMYRKNSSIKTTVWR